MKRRTFLESMAALGVSEAAESLSAQEAPDPSARLLVCGGPEILQIEVAFENGAARLVSRRDWRAATSRGMPADLVPLFKTTDDCKPIDRGSHVLVTSSGGAVAIVDSASGETQFHARVPNAHSADVLPGHRVVAAASDAPEGDKLMVFDRAAAGAPPLFTTTLDSAHGAVWLEEEQTLWALGRSELQAYTLAGWTSARPSLVLRETFKLPSAGGHDLSPVPGAATFLLTTNSEVLTFDRGSKQFAPYEPQAGRPVVKSVAVHPKMKRVVFVQADKPEWWSRTVRFLPGAAVLAFPNDRLYKARWA